MDLTQLKTNQVTSLSNEELANLRDRAAYNATIVENRNVISDGAHRIARHLRSLHYAAEREIENRQKQPDDMRGGAPSLKGPTAFAELSLAGKIYNWVTCDTCLVATYARSVGLGYADVSRTPIPTLTDWTLHGPFTFDNFGLRAQPHTYGAAIDFARALLTNKPACLASDTAAGASESTAL